MCLLLPLLNARRLLSLLLLLRCRERSCSLLEVAMMPCLPLLLLPSVSCRVPSRHAELAIPLSPLRIVCCRERRSCTLPGIALFLLPLPLLLLTRFRE